MLNEKVLTAEASMGSSTLQTFITVITGFYRWLDEISQTDMFWKSKRIGTNKSFLSGQIYNYEYRYLVDGYATMLKSGRGYLKWYDKATKKLYAKIF